VEVSFGMYAELRPVRKLFVGSTLAAPPGRIEQNCSFLAANLLTLVGVCNGRAWGYPARVLTRVGSLYCCLEVDIL
jgi:hypothetical protein